MARARRALILLQVSEEQTQQEQALEAPEPSGEDCEVCGIEMYGLHCKLVCPNCGYRRDCSDP
jgi:rubrerythrin